MPTQITLDVLNTAVAPGGPSCMAFTTELRPAGGWHSSVAPAKYTTRQGAAEYAYEKRFLDGELRDAVVIDSKQSTNNRVEEQVAQAVERGDQPLARLPRIVVDYGNGRRFSDLTLPHRWADGHIRAGSIAGTPTTQTTEYRALRDATPADASALLNRSPFSLAAGAWDSSRKSQQGRWRSIITGEVMGFLPGPAQDNARVPARRGGARVDPVGMKVQLSGTAIQGLVADQRDELSTKTIDDLAKKADADAKAKGGKPVSGSPLGLGGIPPSLEDLAGVTCDRILRSRVLSFAALRQIRFGGDGTADVACRSLLAALALNGIARADAELLLRANCDLVEDGPTSITLDQRGGTQLSLAPLSISEADDLLTKALAAAEATGVVTWDGSALLVTGNPAISGGALDEETTQE